MGHSKFPMPRCSTFFFKSVKSQVYPWSTKFSQFFPQQCKLMGSSAQNSPRCALVQAPGQVQRGSGEGSEGSGEGLGGFGTEPGHLCWGSRKGSGEGLGQVTKGVPEKVLEKVPGSLGAKPSQVQQGSGEGSRVSREGSGEGLGGLFREALVQSQVRFSRICGHLTHGNPAEVFPALGFAARFRKICKNKTLRLLLGIPPKLIIFTKDPALPTYVQFWIR